MTILTHPDNHSILRELAALRNKTLSTVLILGAGPAGYTAAIYAARACLNPLLLTGPLPGGQLTTTTDVENWPGDSSGLTGPQLMDRMYDHAKKFGTEILQDTVVSVDLSVYPFHLKSEKTDYYTKALIVATGASARYLGLASETRYMGMGVSACATCDGFFYKNKKVAVVGGGNTAIQEALYLSNIASQVILIHRRELFRAEAILQQQLRAAIAAGRIKLMLPYSVKEIMGDENGVTGLYVEHTAHDQPATFIEVTGCFIAIGHHPNTQLFHDQITLKNGYISVGKGDSPFATQTSIPGVFAAGDVMDQHYQQAITAAATGCMAALDVERFLMQHSLHVSS